MLPKKGGISMSQVDDKYLELLRARYRAADKKEKGAILDEFVKTTLSALPACPLRQAGRADRQ
jgi:hypothetical protein